MKNTKTCQKQAFVTVVLHFNAIPCCFVDFMQFKPYCGIGAVWQLQTLSWHSLSTNPAGATSVHMCYWI